MSQRMYSYREPAASRPRARQTPSFMDVVNEFSTANRMLMDSMNRMIMDALEPAAPVRERQAYRQKPHKKDDCDCPSPCEHDNCHCECCIVDADVALYARAGEFRILPIRINNLRRREREIKLDLSGWSSHGGRESKIKGAVVGETTFKLGPCEERVILVAIDTREASLSTGSTDAERQRLLDVDQCETLYADLRVEGCSIRPIRIALVMLPRDCDPYVIECGCSCC